MVKVEVTNFDHGGTVHGVEVILAEKLLDDGKYIGPHPVTSNSFGTAIFYKDRPEEDYDRTVIFIALETQFVRHLKGKKPIVQIGIKLKRKSRL